MEYVEINAILKDYPEIKGNLISILHAIQSVYNYLPEDALRYLSQKTGVPLTRLYGIATFYHFFSLTPKGRHQILVCLGTACHVQGSQRILSQVKKRLGVEEGETTHDMRYSLHTVRCVGACSFAPVMIVDQDIHGNTVPTRVNELLSRYQ